MSVVLYHPDYSLKVQHTNLQDAFAEWYQERATRRDFRGFYSPGEAHSLNPRIFSEFLQDMRARFCAACPESLVEQTTMTFGGADGGGGLIYTGVEGEHMDRALQVPQRAAIVGPLTHEAYMYALENRIQSHLPRRALLMMEVGDHGTVVRVQAEFRREVAENIVPARPYLQSNVECVDALTRPQYENLAEHLRFGRMHEVAA